MAGKHPKLTIRPAAVFDVGEIAVVHCEAALAAFADIFPPTASKPTPASLRPRWEQLVADPTATVLVAETTVLVGFVAVLLEPTVPSGMLLDRLYVHPRRWGTGIGSALHDAAVAIAVGLGADAMNLWVLEANTGARTMYERRGWRLVPGRTLQHDTRTVIDVLYQLDIPTSRTHS